METEYGYVIYMAESPDLSMIYVYEIRGNMVKASINNGKPYLSLIRLAVSGRPYFRKNGHKIYLDELEEVKVY